MSSCACIRRCRLTYRKKRAEEGRYGKIFAFGIGERRSHIRVCSPRAYTRYTRSAIVLDNTVSNAVSEVKFHLKTQRLSAQCTIAAAGPTGALAGAIVLIVLEYQVRSLLAARTSTIR